MKLKRVFAYLIDIFIVTFMATFLFGTIPAFQDDYNNYVNLSENYADLLLNSTSGSADINTDELDDMAYNLQIALKPELFMRTGLLIIYFGVMAYLLKGKTIGKMLFKLQTVPNNGENLNPGLFILRSVLVTNLIFEVVSLVILIVCPKNVWLQTSSVIVNISYFIYFLMLGFIIFRDDERGLHDLICKTKVISTKK